MATTTTTTVNLRLTGKDALYFPLKTYVRLRDTVSGTTYAGTTYVDGDGGATILAVPFAPPTAYYTEISPTGTGSWTIVDPTTVSAPPFAATAGTLKLIGPPNLTPFTVVADDFFASNPLYELARADFNPANPTYAGGAKFDGVTLDTAAMQACMDAATAVTSGGTAVAAKMTCPPGVSICDGLIHKPRVHLAGAGATNTILMARTGATNDVIQGYNFLTLTGKIYQAGDYALGARDVELSDICLDGNRANVTSGWCARYWTGSIHGNGTVLFRNGKDGNLWTEFTDVDNFLDSAQRLENFWNKIVLINSGGHGYVCRGPHDGVISQIYSYNHVGTSVRAEATSLASVIPTAATASANIATFTVPSSNQKNAFVVGQTIVVSGMTPAAYNGTWIILSLTNPADPQIGPWTQITANIGTTPAAGSVFGTIVGQRGFNGAVSFSYANTFLVGQGSYYANVSLRLYAGLASAANLYPGILFDAGSGNCRATGMDIGGHQPGIVLRGSNQLIEVVGTNNLGDLIYIDGAGWSEIRFLGTNNANGLFVNSQNGPNRIAGRLNAQAAGSTKAVTSATASGNVATFTVASHGYVVGQVLAILGVTPTGYNGNWRVATVVDANTFTCPIATTPGALSIAGTAGPPLQTAKRTAGGVAFGPFDTIDVVGSGSQTDITFQIPTATITAAGWSPQLPTDNGVLLSDKTGAANPTAAAGANNGASPPAPVLAGSPARGTVTFGSGTGPAAGAQTVVTLPSGVFAATPAVVICPSNQLTAALAPYATEDSATQFTIGTNIAPAASQANTTYKITYWIPTAK